MKVASNPAGRYQDAEREARAVIQASDRPRLVSLQDVGQLRLERVAVLIAREVPALASP